MHPAGRLAGIPWRKVGLVSACVVVALILAGQVIFLVNAAHSGLSVSGTGPSIGTKGSLSQRLAPALTAVLGPSDRGVRRYTLTVNSQPPHKVSDLSVRWAINNDLSAGSVGNGAAVDVYAMLRAIYTSGLPVAKVSLTGTYPVRGREGVVMRLTMSRSDASRVADYGWDNLDPQSLWPLVERRYVYPPLQPLNNE